VVYGGFSDQALADRIADAKSKVVVASDGVLVARENRPPQERRG
jgi:acyl-coenzyme A synthetase/AMP-(fatty) acid ligase